MAQRCSLFGIQAIPCGESRGERSIVDLVECNDDITAQLATCHLSRSGLKESELILARAGLFHLTEEQIRNIKVCPSHRYNLGRFWRPRITCQHPSHSGSASRCKGRNAFNLQLSQDVYTFHGVLVPVGSRKYHYNIY